MCSGCARRLGLGPSAGELHAGGTATLRALGLDAVEVEYPGYRAGRIQRLRAMARELGLAISGGSDCHGPDSPARSVGSRSISREELETLRGVHCRRVSPSSRALHTIS